MQKLITKGFTLVEISIVLVVIALVAGGVMVGLDMIKAAEVRAVATELQQFRAAVKTFQAQYDALPGDMTNATEFWGTNANCPGTYTQGTFDGTTCNGNGNDWNDYEGGSSNPTMNETFRFWQHLSNAGLIEGSYDGVTAHATGYFLGVGDTNCPKSKMKNGYWSAASVTSSSSIFAYSNKPFEYIFGARAGTSWNYNRILTPRDAWKLDSKIDDGKPGKGLALAIVGVSCNDATSNTDYDADYLKGDNSNVTCMMFFNHTRQEKQ